MELFYSEIKVADRFRRELGDIESLKVSIQKLGQLQPIVISEDHQLICGYRRLQACKELKRPVEVKIVNIDDWLLEAEHDENEERKDFTFSERVAIKQAMEHRIGNRQGQRTDQLPSHGTEVKPGQETRDYAARKAGFDSATTALRAEAIVAKGTPELVEAVDKGEISIRPAYAIADLPKEEQTAIVKQGKKAVTKKAKEIEQTKGRGKGKKSSSGETALELQRRSLAMLSGKKIGISREEFDPDFKGTSMEFVDKYGHVQLVTKAELEEANDRAAFSAWVAAIRSLKTPLSKFLEGATFKPENFERWIKKAKSPAARMIEVRELVSLIVETQKRIDWLMRLLETNGDHR